MKSIHYQEPTFGVKKCICSSLIFGAYRCVLEHQHVCCAATGCSITQCLWSGSVVWRLPSPAALLQERPVQIHKGKEKKIGDDYFKNFSL